MTPGRPAGEAKRLHHRKDRRVCTDAKRQRQDSGCGEARRLAEHAEAVAKVLGEVLNPSDAAGAAAFLFRLLDTTQVQSRPAMRFFFRHSLRDAFLGFSVKVIAQLVVQLLVRLRPAKQRPHPQWNREQPTLRSHSDLCYSYRSATIGSTRMARRAGM